MTDEYLLEYGFKQYNPTSFDSWQVVSRFQKRYDDDFGKKYFIDVVKISNDYVPDDKRGDWWTPYSYYYEVRTTMFREGKTMNLKFFSEWDIKEVEDMVEKMFSTMKFNYYESWKEERE